MAVLLDRSPRRRILLYAKGWLERVEEAVSSSLELKAAANNQSADAGIRHMTE
jgi:hypothetical protein